MKYKLTKKARAIVPLAAAICLLPPTFSQADDLFRLYWRGIAYGPGPGGTIVSHYITEQNFVNKIAEDNGLDPSKYVLVFRPDRRDTGVVEAATGKFIADFQTMEFLATAITNANGTRVVRQAFIYDELHTNPIGSFVGSEYPVRDANGNLLNDYLGGMWQFAIPETNGVYFGNLYTGARVVDKTGTPP